VETNNSSNPLHERAIVVTGASKGIGRATALALGAAGARVALVARDAAGLESAVNEIGAGAIAVRADVRDAAACDGMAAGVLDRWGRIDACVCSAGIGHWGMVHEFPPEQWAETMGINVDGTFHTVRAVLPAMLAQGSGHIITVSSIYGRKGSPGFAAYCASKYAIIGFSESLALEVRPQGIKVTVVEPGTVDTGFRDGMTNRPRTGLLTHPDKMLTPDDVANAIVWALSTSPTAVPDEIRLDTARW
jgi:NAD(P)-dependent dehydrogenase (short-subunit alcohol dehydrogenase family)